MRKLIVPAFLAILVFSGTLGAEEPVPFLSFTQEVDTGIVDNEVGGNYLTDGDTLYLTFEMKGGANFTFGTVTLAPWMSAVYEAGDGDGGYQMGTASVGLDAAFAVSEPLNFYAGLTMSWEIPVGGELVPYLTPLFGLNGEIAGFSYDLSGDVVLYFTDDGTDLDIEAALEAGYAFPLDLTVTLTDEFCYELAWLDGEVPAMTNDMTLVLSGVIGPLSPYAGPAFSIGTNDGETDTLFIGFTAGIDVAVDTWSFGLSYTGGSETEGEAMIGAFVASLSLSL